MHALIKPAIAKYLNDNGAAPICKTHLDPLTNAIAEAIENGTVQLIGKLTMISTPAKVEDEVQAEVGAEIQIASELVGGTIMFQGDLQQPFVDGDVLISISQERDTNPCLTPQSPAMRFASGIIIDDAAIPTLEIESQFVFGRVYFKGWSEFSALQKGRKVEVGFRVVTEPGSQ
jgi:hypothetical protein